jgi:hypothetical protein
MPGPAIRHRKKVAFPLNPAPPWTLAPQDPATRSLKVFFNYIYQLLKSSNINTKSLYGELKIGAIGTIFIVGTGSFEGGIS